MKKQFHLKNTQFYSDLANHSKFKKSVQQIAKNCTSPNICSHKSSQAEKKKWSQKFEELLDGTNTQMVFDLNPSIELQIKPLDSTPYFSYVLEPIKMTGTFVGANIWRSTVFGNLLNWFFEFWMISQITVKLCIF